MKLFEILKFRWQEILMVAGLQACCMFLMLDFQHTHENPSNFGVSFMLGVIIALFGIVSQILLLGFLYTAAVEGTKPARPVELLRIGRVYLWRLVLFHIMLLPALLLIFIIIQFGAQSLLRIKMESQPPLWLGIAGETSAILILMKPVFFIPALIILRNCGIGEAWRNLREIRLSQTGYFRIIAISIMVVIGAAGYLSGIARPQDSFYYPVLSLHALTMATGTLIIFLIAVLETHEIISKKLNEAAEIKQEND